MQGELLQPSMTEDYSKLKGEYYNVVNNALQSKGIFSLLDIFKIWTNCSMELGFADVL